MCFVRNLLRALVCVVAAACAAQPIALDACHAACERVKTARVAASPCHHVAPAGPQIGQSARPCGQDHALMPSDGPGAAPKTQMTLSTPPGDITSFAHRPLRGAAVESAPPSVLITSISNTPLRV
jgi:hypothetical protein